MVQRPVKLIDLIVWLLTDDCSFDNLIDIRCILQCLLKRLYCGFVLQIRFTVQILSLHVAHAFDFGALCEDHICGEKLIAGDLDYLSDFHLVPFNSYEVLAYGIVDKSLLLVLLPVRLVPLRILKDILYHTHTDNEEEG